MEHDPILKDIDAECVQASAEAARLGRRVRMSRLLVADAPPSLLTRLQHPDQQPAEVTSTPIAVKQR